MNDLMTLFTPHAQFEAEGSGVENADVLKHLVKWQSKVSVCPVLRRGLLKSIYQCLKLSEKKTRKDNQLHEIEIREVDKQKKRIKIDYKGFSEDTDEWRDYGDDLFPFVRLQKAYVPQEISFEDRKNSLHGQLYSEVKRKLWSGHRDDPDIRIELNIDPDVFDQGLGLVVKARYQRQREVYEITNNHDLDDLLGLKWNERIVNENGDFAYVIDGTVKYWLSKKSSIVEYKYIGEKYIKSEIEDSHILVFTFI